ncbi:MAG: hydantoinase/oxoprolinase family protein [Ectothiorhodospiraceae bacterium]|nr:hydantoinase/oxoprolinase family protein [Ectothiorhodospiraceae bacterium]
MSGFALALDVGGTFTDVILIRRDGGALWTAKASSTPSDPAEGFFDGIEKVLARSAVDPGEVATLLHGSTVATNAILEGKGALTGMLVTDGFKYVLEVGRAEVPRKENLFAWVKPARPVPPRRILEAPERVLVDGTVARPLDEAACEAAARTFAALGVRAVAVVFLHAYANPAHERRAGEILAAALPGVEIALSSDVLPVFREYERAVATVLNASVQPVVARYVRRLVDGAAARGIHAPLHVMKSNGGVFTPEQAARQSVQMALSGPAAGAQGAAYLAGLAGVRDLVTIDMGGTSADVCLVRDGAPSITLDGVIGPYPLSLPIVDIHTIGAGGGSIATVSDLGGLAVGPRSAGADPGPACYGKGGEEPTVTDANLVLGRIPPHLLDGEIPLDVEAAHRAIETRVAAPLGLDVVEAARGIVAIVDNNMVGALKVVSVERGYDPRAFALCAFGGAGPVHGASLARLLGTGSLFVPRYPGILCAMGLLATDQQYDLVRTRIQRPPRYDLAAMAEILAELLAEGDARLAAEGVPAERRRLSRAADLRYARQGVELTVPFEAERVDAESIARLVEDYHALHERLYTFADREAPVEIVNLRVTATGLMDRVTLPRLDAVAAGTPAPVHAERRVAFDADFVTTPVHRREALRPGHRVVGPAIVDQADTTTVVPPGCIATVDVFGNLSVAVGGAAARDRMRPVEGQP